MPIADPFDRVRRGISLLEVLISIGILAIGLSSIVAMIPAGRSQAARAVILDRASALAANALADAATFGVLRPDSLTAGGTVAIDPVGSLTAAGFTAASPRTVGIFATPSSPGSATPAGYATLFTQSRDDILVNGTASTDDAPLNVMNDGVRGFEGRMSAILCLRPDAAAPTTRGTLSAVVFHGRDTSITAVTGTIVNGGVDLASLSGGGDRSAKDLIKPGVVAFANSQFHQAMAASFVAPTATTGTVYLTFSTGTALMSGTASVTFLPDSVGLAERPFSYEYDSPYTQ